MPDRVPTTSLFWQTEAVMAEASDRTGLETSLLPILALHASRVSFQWELIAQLASRSGLPDLVDLLIKAAEQRRRISQRIEAARGIQRPKESDMPSSSSVDQGHDIYIVGLRTNTPSKTRRLNCSNARWGGSRIIRKCGIGCSVISRKAASRPDA